MNALINPTSVPMWVAVNKASEASVSVFNLRAAKKRKMPRTGGKKFTETLATQAAT